MTSIPETLCQAREALLQSAAALTTIAEALEGADESAPAAEPGPGEWRNDRAPKECDTNDALRVWVWQSWAPVLVSCDLVSFWYESCPARNYWAPGNRPAPKSPPPDVVGSQEPEPKPEPEKPRSFFPFTPEELAAICAKREESRTGGWIVDRVPEEKDGDSDDDVRVPARFGVGYAWINWKHVHPGSPWSRTGAEPGPWDPTCLDRNGWIRSRLPTVEDANGVGVVLIPMGRFGGTNGITAYDLIVPGQPWAPWGSTPGRFEK